MDIPSLLKSTGLKPVEIARRTEVSDGHIFDLLSGRRRITLKMAKRLDSGLKTRGAFVKIAIQQQLSS